jgi:hypothetical protein
MSLVRTAIRFGIAATAAAVVALSGGTPAAQASAPASQDAGQVATFGGGMSYEN